MSRVDTAGRLFTDGRSCSQAVFSAFAPSLGIDTPTSIRLASGFGGGMRIGGTCGAATGALLVIGLAYCDEECTSESGKTVMKAVETFLTRFRDEVGATDCPAILGCDVRTAEGREWMQQQGLRESTCLPAVRSAARILEEMLASDA